jgi:hypothetical protein
MPAFSFGVFGPLRRCLVRRCFSLHFAVPEISARAPRSNKSIAAENAFTKERTNEGGAGAELGEVGKAAMGRLEYWCQRWERRYLESSC